MRQLYIRCPELSAFQPFPKDVDAQPFNPNPRAVSKVMQADNALRSGRYAVLQKAVMDAAPFMHWRETYKDDRFDTSFMARFGCFSVIGDNAPFTSQSLRLFIVYMPAGLYYPWHKHPAEELYFIIAGQAVFKRAGCRDTMLSEGQMMRHESNQAHALEAKDSSILCLVAWRTHLTILPVMTPIRTCWCPHRPRINALSVLPFAGCYQLRRKR